jgi:hypothetical protein
LFQQLKPFQHPNKLIAKSTYFTKSNSFAVVYLETFIINAYGDYFNVWLSEN